MELTEALHIMSGAFLCQRCSAFNYTGLMNVVRVEVLQSTDLYFLSALESKYNSTSGYEKPHERCAVPSHRAIRQGRVNVIFSQFHQVDSCRLALLKGFIKALAARRNAGTEHQQLVQEPDSREQAKPLTALQTLSPP